MDHEKERCSMLLGMLDLSRCDCDTEQLCDLKVSILMFWN